MFQAYKKMYSPNLILWLGVHFKNFIVSIPQHNSDIEVDPKYKGTIVDLSGAWHGKVYAC